MNTSQEREIEIQIQPPLERQERQIDSLIEIQIQPTPLPWLKLLVASSNIFCNTFMMTTLMPFLTFLIDDLHVAPTPEDIGRYSGYLVSSFMLGQLLFSYTWGWLSDHYGRRPVMLIGLFLTGVSFLLFGFVKSYEAALIIRFLTGSFNGIIGATKTYISEITDETNQARGFAIFGVARGLGMVIGPIVGGFLCLPHEKYPEIFPKGSLFDQFPYLLPCVVGFVVAIAGTLLGFFVLQETNQVVIRKQQLQRAAEREESEPTASDPLLLPGGTSSSSLEEGVEEATKVPAKMPKTMWQMFQSRKVVLSLLLYTLVSFTYIQFDELFALWSRLPYDEGGLEFDSSTMGKAYSIGGFSLFFYQIFLFGPIERYLGTLKTFQTGLIFSLPAFLLLPLAGLVRDNESAVWLIIGVSQVLRACAGVQAFTAVFLMVSNSITAESRGSLNGVGQTLGSMGRMGGPVFAGVLFSWSLENGMKFPFDYHFVFLILGLVVFSTLCVSFLLSKDIDQRERDEDDDQSMDAEEEEVVADEETAGNM